jgi:aubergine
MIKFPFKGAMTVGFDVTHDTNNRNKSYGAFVASMDLKEKVQYFSSVSQHKDSSELSKNIESHLVKALKVYLETHNYLPEIIFFYRDGVSDGQIEMIHKHEIAKMEQTLRSVYKVQGLEPPKMAVIIVNKRINTRIFLTQGNKSVNPASGTVVDNTITLPER